MPSIAKANAVASGNKTVVSAAGLYVYKRPDGTSNFLRPDGTSTFKRP